MATSVAAIGFLTGCTIRLSDETNLVEHRLGYVKVVAREDPVTAVRIVEAQTAGLWIVDSGLGPTGGIGFRADRRKLVPLDCKVVIWVADRVDLDAAVELLKGMGGSNICVVRD